MVWVVQDPRARLLGEATPLPLVVGYRRQQGHCPPLAPQKPADLLAKLARPGSFEWVAPGSRSRLHGPPLNPRRRRDDHPDAWGRWGSARPVSDRRRRQLERDPGQRDALVRHLQREQDQEALCELGEHAYGEPEPWIVIPKPVSVGFSELVPGTIFRLNGITERCVRCAACDAEAAVHWVTHLFGAGLDHYKQCRALEALTDLRLGDGGVAYMHADGTVELLDPLYVNDDRTSPIGIAVEAADQGETIPTVLPE